MFKNSGRTPKLVPRPLVVGERAGLAAILAKEGFPHDDLDAAARWFWRFDTLQDVPLGFGGLELHGADALLRSVVTLPPVRGRGIGSAIVGMLEAEASIAGCGTIYLATATASSFFDRLGYMRCGRASVPRAVRDAPQFIALPGEALIEMAKRLR